MKYALQISAAVISLVCSMSVSAHHAAVSTYDLDKTTSVQGVVTNFLFKNPHARVYFEVTNQDGSVTEWVGDGSASTILRREGWTRDTLKPGDFIQIIGSSSRDGSSMVMMDSVSMLEEDGSIASEIYGSVEDFSVTYTTDLLELPTELSEGIPNLTGIWTGQGSPFAPPRGVQPPLSEVGLALQQNYDIATDPQVFCDTPGIVRQGGMTPHGIRITQYDDRVVFEYEEYGITQIAYFDPAMSNTGIKTHMGDSVARYQNDTLIVTTTNLLSEQMHAGSMRMSDQTTVVQTYKRVDQPDVSALLEIKTMISDPINYAEDFEFSNTKIISEPYEFIENVCVPPLRERKVVHPAMNFFVTSVGLADIASPDDLTIADAHCKTLASNVGQGDKEWVAYLDATDSERIIPSPWYDAKGDVIVTELESSEGPLWTEIASTVTERGAELNKRAADDGLFYCFAR